MDHAHQRRVEVRKQVVGGLAACPLPLVVLQQDWFVAEYRHHVPYERRGIVHVLQLVQDAAVVQPEAYDVVILRQRREVAYEPVVEPPRHGHHGVAGGLPALPPYEHRAVLPFPNEVDDHLGRLLEVAAEEDRRIAP